MTEEKKEHLMTEEKKEQEKFFLSSFSKQNGQENLRRPATYIINNIKTNRLFIGSTNNLYHTIRLHIYHLRQSIHEHRLFQVDYNDYGIDSFIVTILENNKMRLSISTLPYEKFSSIHLYNIDLGFPTIGRYYQDYMIDQKMIDAALTLQKEMNIKSSADLLLDKAIKKSRQKEKLTREVMDEVFPDEEYSKQYKKRSLKRLTIRLARFRSKMREIFFKTDKKAREKKELITEVMDEEHLEGE